MRTGHCLRQLELGAQWKRIECALVASFILACVVAPRSAHAQTGLLVRVPDGCGSKGAFVAELVALKHSQAAVEQLALAVEIQSTETEFALKLTDVAGTRELRDPSCETLFRTAVVIAAASMTAPERELAPGGAESADPAAAAPSSASTSPPPAAPSATAAVAPSSSPPRGSVTTPNVPSAEREGEVDGEGEVVGEREPWANDVGPEFMLGAGAVFGSTPKLSFGAEAGAALGLERWSLRALARYVPTSTTNAAAGARLATEVWGGRLSVGYEVTRTVRVELGVSASRIRATTVGIRYPGSDSVWFLAPEVEAAFELARWTDWSVEVALLGRIALNTPRFEMEPNSSVVFTVPRVGAAGFFRLKWGP